MESLEMDDAWAGFCDTVPPACAAASAGTCVSRDDSCPETAPGSATTADAGCAFIGTVPSCACAVAMNITNIKPKTYPDLNHR